MLLLLNRVVLEQAAVESMRTPASAPIQSTVADLICLPPSRGVVGRFLLLILLAPLPSNARWAFPQEYARMWATPAPLRVLAEIPRARRRGDGARRLDDMHDLLVSHEGRPTLEK
jgi:hypothetical protein